MENNTPSPLNNSEMDALRTQLNAVYDKLWSAIPEPRPVKPHLNWEVAPSSENPSVMFTGNTVTFSADALQNMDNEAQIAALMALSFCEEGRWQQRAFRGIVSKWRSELETAMDQTTSHAEARDVLGQPAVSAVYWLRKSGYDTDEFTKSFEKLGNKSFIIGLGRYSKENYSRAVTGINHLKGNQKHDSDGVKPVSGSPLNANVRKGLDAYFNEIDKTKKAAYQKIKTQWTSYDNASLQEKTEILNWAIDSLASGENEEFLSWDEVRQRMKALPLKDVSAKDRPHVETLIQSVLALNTSIDRIENAIDSDDLSGNYKKKLELAKMVAGTGIGFLTGNNNGTKLYDALVEAETGEAPTRRMTRPLVGEGLKELEKKIQEFTSAKTDEEIIKAAQGISRLTDKYPINMDVAHIIHMKGFSWPENMHEQTQFVSPPWERHAKIAQGQNPGSSQVTNALFMLDVMAFISPEWKKPSVTWGTESIPYTLGSGRNEKEFYIRDDGKVMPVAVSDKEFQTRFIADKKAQAEARVKDADWGELQTDFSGFVQKYEDHLKPYEVLNKTHRKPITQKAIAKVSRGVAGKAADNASVSRIVLDTPPEFINELVKRAGQIQDASFKESYATFLDEQIKSALLNRKALSHDHPYLKAYLDLDNVPLQQKLNALTGVEVWKKGTGSIEERWQFTQLEKLGYDTNNPSLEKLEQWVVNVQGANKGLPSYATPLVAYAAYDTVKNMKSFASSNEFARVRNLASLVEGTPVQDVFNAKVEELVFSFAGTGELKGSIEEQIGLYKIIASHQENEGRLLDQMPALRNNFESSFKKQIQEKLASGLPDERQKGQNLLLDLLAYQSISHESGNEQKVSGTYRGVNLNSPFGKWAADTYLAEWADSFVAKHGTGSKAQDIEAHTAAFNTELESLCTKLLPEGTEGKPGHSYVAASAHMEEILRVMSLKKVGNVLMLQQGAAEYLEDKTKTYHIERNGIAADTGNTTLDKAVEDSGTMLLQQNFLKRFLLEPYTDKSADKLIQKFSGELNFLGLIKLPLNVPSEVFSAHLSREKKLEIAQDIHTAFWDMDFKERNATMSQLLDHGFGIESKDALAQVKNQALPRPHRFASNYKEMVRAREMVDAYLSVCEPEKAEALMLGMMVANKPGASNEETVSVGTGLRLILSTLGPAGDKLLQAIQSYPGTPEDIAADLRDTKNNAHDLKRSVITRMVEESNKDVPEEGHKIVSTGAVLGSGSYGVTVEGLRADGELVARTIYYDQAYSQAKTEFDTMQKAMKILEKRDPKFYAPIKHLVDQAARMADLEMNPDRVKPSADAADAIYGVIDNPVKNISVKLDDDVEVQSFSAPYKGHGKRYKDFAIVKGGHFLDYVKEAEASEKNHKGEEKTQARKDVENLAVSLMTMELSFLLRGLPQDFDRHGGNQCIEKVKENGKTIFRVGQFDLGAMDFLAANDRQKQMIGHALAGLIYDLEVKKKSFGKALLKEMNEIPRDQDEVNYLSQIQRGVLALGNFAENLPEDKRVSHIIGALQQQGFIDPLVEKSMRERLEKMPGKGKAFADRVFEEFKKNSEKVSIHLTSEIDLDKLQKYPHKPAIDEIPPLGKGLDAIPVADSHIRNAAIGAGVVAGVAATGMAVKANQKRKESKQQEEAQQEQSKPKKPIMRRVFKVIGAVVALGGVALMADGALNKGRITRQTAGGLVGDKNAAVFKAGTTIVAGSALVAAGAVISLFSRKGKEKKQSETADDGKWRAQAGNSTEMAEQGQSR